MVWSPGKSALYNEAAQAVREGLAVASPRGERPARGGCLGATSPTEFCALILVDGAPARDDSSLPRSNPCGW